MFFVLKIPLNNLADKIDCKSFAKIGSPDSFYQDFEIPSSHFKLTESVNLNYLEDYHFYENPYYAAIICETSEIIYDV